MDSSPFAHLSPELRNLIYEHVFTSPYATSLQHNQIQHALTRTSRQLRYETLEMFYTLTRFNSHLDDEPLTPLGDWLRALPPAHTLLIRMINVWDLHDLQATLYGEADTHRVLSMPVLREECGPHARYALAPTGPGAVTYGLKLDPVITALHVRGLGLAQIYVCPEGMGENDALKSERVHWTSEFGFVWLPGRHDVRGLGRHLGLSKLMNSDLEDQWTIGKCEILLQDGKREVRLQLDGDRVVAALHSSINEI